MGIFAHNEQEICSDLWKVFKNHYNDETNQQAEVGFAELNAVCKKHGSEFCNAMAVAMNDQLMRRWDENHPRGVKS